MNNKRSKSIAVRSESIIEARFALTPKQNELLDMLLCEIKDDDQYQYVISVDKYKDFYQTDISNLYRDLRKAVKGFEGKGFRIINKDTNEEIFYTWFSKIHYIPKKGEIKVNVDLDFKRLLWEVKKRIYYDIKYTLNFKSGYSQRMYYYLKSFEDTGWRIDEVDKLLAKLECPPSYSNFADFKRAVLDVATKEINSLSDITFTYETQKTRRKITHLKFYIQSKQKSPALQEVVTNKVIDNKTQLILEVRKFIKEELRDNDIIEILESANDNIELIRKQYNYMKTQKQIRNIVGWLKEAVKKRYRENIISHEKQDNFNNFSQRTYDYNELETQLREVAFTKDEGDQVGIEEMLKELRNV